jgi:3-methyladenine DNA glycosylase AlkD
MKAKEADKKLLALANPVRAAASQRYFKTGPGEYGEGDRFLGIAVPVLRGLAKECDGLPLDEIVTLLHSPVHENRFLALLVLCRAYAKGNETVKNRIFSTYLENSAYINNWDLVDCSAEHVVGPYLKHRERDPLYTLTASSLIWDRRIAIMATFHYIKGSEFKETFGIAERLLSDPQDLIHKAVGWMLREIGKRNRAAEDAFLQVHYKTMPRTMLRYAVERHPEEGRQRYLRGEV